MTRYGQTIAVLTLIGVGLAIVFSGRGEADRWTTETHLVDLNRDGVLEISTLPGVGSAKAEAIVNNRSEHGPFESLRDVARVKGIGPATLEKWRGRVLDPGRDGKAP